MSADQLDSAVLIMARAPRAGAVKTRLQPLLGPDGCARLQTRLIRRTAQLASQVAPGRTYLAFDPPDAIAEFRSLVPAEVALLTQCGGDLGTRMSAAVADVASAHSGPITVIGTDTPTLTAAHLREAVDRIDEGADAVIGPALDGGYYLIALRHSTPCLFAIEPGLWGGPDVLAATLAVAAAASVRVALLNPLRDLDTPADARAFLSEPGLPDDIAAALHVHEPAR